MARSTGIINWEALGKTTNLAQAIRFIPREMVIQELGGMARIIQEEGPEQVARQAMEQLSPEQREAIFRSMQPKEQVRADEPKAKE